MQAEACIVSAANGAGDGVGVLAVICQLWGWQAAHFIALFA